MRTVTLFFGQCILNIKGIFFFVEFISLPIVSLNLIETVWVSTLYSPSVKWKSQSIILSLDGCHKECRHCLSRAATDISHFLGSAFCCPPKGVWTGHRRSTARLSWTNKWNRLQFTKLARILCWSRGCFSNHGEPLVKTLWSFDGGLWRYFHTLKPFPWQAQRKVFRQPTCNIRQKKQGLSG